MYVRIRMAQILYVLLLLYFMMDVRTYVRVCCIIMLLEACRACVGRAQRKSLCMNFVLRTAHAEEKKKGGHTNSDVRTIIITYEKSQMYRPCGARFARPIMHTLLRCMCSQTAAFEAHPPVSFPSSLNTAELSGPATFADIST